MNDLAVRAVGLARSRMRQVLVLPSQFFSVDGSVQEAVEQLPPPSPAFEPPSFPPCHCRHRRHHRWSARRRRRRRRHAATIVPSKHGGDHQERAKSRRRPHVFHLATGASGAENRGCPYLLNWGTHLLCRRPDMRLTFRTFIVLGPQFADGAVLAFEASAGTHYAALINLSASAARLRRLLDLRGRVGRRACSRPCSPKGRFDQRGARCTRAERSCSRRLLRCRTPSSRSTSS